MGDGLAGRPQGKVIRGQLHLYPGCLSGCMARLKAGAIGLCGCYSNLSQKMLFMADRQANAKVMHMIFLGGPQAV